MESVRIGLKQAIEALHTELADAIGNIQHSDVLAFRYQEIELELVIEVAHETSGRAGVTFWVVEGGGETARSNSRTNRVTIRIEPFDPGTGERPHV